MKASAVCSVCLLVVVVSTAGAQTFDGNRLATPTPPPTLVEPPLVEGPPPIGAGVAIAAPPCVPRPRRYVGLRPLVEVRRQPVAIQLRPGLFGQPTVYVPRQPVRNFFRYLGP